MSSNKKDEVLNNIQTQWNNWMKKEIVFELIDSHDIQVITPFIDYFGDGIIFNEYCPEIPVF